MYLCLLVVWMFSRGLVSSTVGMSFLALLRGNAFGISSYQAFGMSFLGVYGVFRFGRFGSFVIYDIQCVWSTYLATLRG